MSLSSLPAQTWKEDFDKSVKVYLCSPWLKNRDRELLALKEMCKRESAWGWYKELLSKFHFLSNEEYSIRLNVITAYGPSKN